MASTSENVVEERKEKALHFVKKNPHVLGYIVLAVIIILAIYIRTLPMATNPATGKPGLWDITTDSWTLGPDLDPFLFLRWAKDINADGVLAHTDTLRYVPLGFMTNAELLLLPYSISWFHTILSSLGLSNSVTYSAVIFPVFFFALTIIAFFFMTREMFIDSRGKKQATIIGLISSLFLALMPSLLPRTIAGIPEKESAAFFFLFLTFFLFIKGWKSEKKMTGLAFALGAGITTTLMALIWGGVTYIFVTIALAGLLAFIFGKSNMHTFKVYGLWLLSSLLFMTFYSSRYTLGNYIVSTTTLIPLFVGVIMGINELLRLPQLQKPISKYTRVIPQPLLVIAGVFIVGLIGALLFLGPSFIADKVKDITGPMITPIQDRLGVTVAENKQPFFYEWAYSFGPIYYGIPVFFWLFFFGALALMYVSLHSFPKKERLILAGSYVFFLIALIFSRYSADSAFNGTNIPSLAFYLLGFIALISIFGRSYLKHNKTNAQETFASFDFALIILFSFFFFSIISARGSVRTIMVLVPTAAILASFLLVYVFHILPLKKNLDSKNWLALGVLAFITLLFALSAMSFYTSSVSSAGGYVPSIYTLQWQKAMAWVRDTTVPNAVFAHWWDYGYWVQSLGERATVLDGGNYIGYWNHLMGRHALTGTSSLEAARFLYAHNVTHFLIDSSDVGKYAAFSSIGSNQSYDRRSWIPSFVKDDSQTVEAKNKTTYVYRGGFSLDEDITYMENGTRIFLPGVGNQNMDAPSMVAGLGAIVVDSTNDQLSQPRGVFIYQGKQITLPLRYAFYTNELIDFGSGIDAGVFFMPMVIQDAQGLKMGENGALLYLSSRTVHSQLARLYLYGEEDSIFSLAHSEDDVLVESIKTQGITSSDFVFYQGVRGPIKIWSVSYPQGMTIDSSFLNVTYPAELRAA